MIKNRDIICLASQDWDTHLCVPQQTMCRLAKHNRILYVNVPRSVLSIFRRSEDGYSKTRSTALRTVKVGDENVYVYAPAAVFLPANSLPASLSILNGKINAWLMSYFLRRLMRKLNMQNPILWIYSVAASQMVEQFRSSLTIYDCIDEWPGYMTAGIKKSNTERMDRDLCKKSNLVFLGSKNLCSRKSHLNKNTYYVPHAADFDLFVKASNTEIGVAEDIAGLEKPVIGLVGILEKRVDLNILEKMAKSHLEWSIALVGPVWENLDVSALRALPNVYFLGMKEVNALPDYIRAFDVCTVPYVIDDFTRNIYPLKLHEYLASGKPIVSTRIPAIADYEDEGLVRIADTPTEFVSAVEAALDENDEELETRRIEEARANTWEARVELKSSYIVDHQSR